MKKKKIISILLVLVILLEIFMPNLYKCYATEIEEIENDIELESKINENDDAEVLNQENNEEIENIDEEVKDDENNNDNDNDNKTLIIENDIINEESDLVEEEKNDNIEEIDNKESDIENINDDAQSIEDEEFIIEENHDNEIMLMSASGGGTGAGNEDEFRNAFYNGGVSELTTSTTIRLNSTYVLNHSLRIDSSSQTGSNSIQLSSGCSIVVPSGCVLTLDGMVIDGRTHGNNDGKSCITVQNGGVLMLIEHSIIDGGTSNWGISVEAGGQLLIESGQVSYCDRGIVAQGNSYCDLASNTAVQCWGNSGKSVDISHNNIGIYCGNAYSGTFIVNHTSQNSEKINIESNTFGIYSEQHSGNISIVNARMVNNGWAIYTFGNMNVSGINGAYNSRGIVNDGGTVNFNSGSFYADASNLKDYGIYNNSGTVNMRGGSVSNNKVGIYNLGTINMSSGNSTYNTTGVENYGTINFSGGNINNNSKYGIQNEGSTTITGQAYITGGTISGNGSYDIYNTKSDSYGAGGIYGGLRIERNDTINSSIYLGRNDSYIYTGSNTPTLNNITINSAFLERNIIRTSSNANATTMNGKITVKNKGNYYYKANASGHSSLVALWINYTVTTYYKTTSGITLGTVSNSYSYKNSYTTSEKTFENYILSSTPTNASGTVTGNIAVTYYYKDDRNVAVVNYKELLSGVQSAVYWYNANSESFSGSGTSFNDGKVFEDYGFYKITVTNGVGLSKTLTFVLNKDSI